MEAATLQGKLEAVRCFGAPHIQQSWERDLNRCGMDFTAVARRGILEGEPNDLAICEEADRIAAEAPDTVIAIASKDRDFIEQHLRLQRKGVQSVQVVPYVSDFLRFKEAGIDVVQLRAESGKERPGWTGAEKYEQRFGLPYNATMVRNISAPRVWRALERLGYTLPDKTPFPSARSLALFLEVHGVKDVELYPRCIGVQLAVEVIEAAAASGWDLQPNPGNLNFFEARVGTRRAGADGNWLVAPTGPGLALRILEWLGWAPGPPDSIGFRDELEAFWQFNAKSFRNNLKHSILPSYTAQETPEERLAFLELAFGEEAAQQQWRPPPNDEDFRRFLRGLGLLADQGAPQCEVEEALAEYLGQERIHSYALALLQARDKITSRSDPLERRPELETASK